MDNSRRYIYREKAMEEQRETLEELLVTKKVTATKIK